MMPKSLSVFTSSLDEIKPPKAWPDALKSLWYDYKGDWNKAHDLVDQLADRNSKWVHAYLHRKEGDDWNARYWYRQAGKPFPNTDLDTERGDLVGHIITH